MIVECGQPGALARRQPAHARGARRARAARRHRRRHDRDGPPRRLRAAGARRSTRSGRRRSSTSSSRTTTSTSAARCSSRSPGTLPEPEIHARLVRGPRRLDRRRPRAAARGRAPRAAPPSPTRSSPPWRQARARLDSCPVLLYRTLGPTLPDGAAAAARAVGRGAAPARCEHPEAVRRAGFEATALALGEHALRRHPRQPVGRDLRRRRATRRAGRRMRGPEGKVNLRVPAVAGRARWPRRRAAARPDPAFPFVLSAGERRSFTANTIFRDPRGARRTPTARCA